MPAGTMPGAMIRAMLAAYRRTLQKTMAQARSMQQVVDEARLAWLETPDQAVVWGLALGLQDEIEQVLERTLDDVTDGRRDRRPLPAGLVLQRLGRGRRRRRSAAWRRAVLELGDPGLRRDDVGAGHHRQLAVVIGFGGGGFGGGGRAVAEAAPAAGSEAPRACRVRGLHSGHGCRRHDGRVLRAAQRRRSRRGRRR